MGNLRHRPSAQLALVGLALLVGVPRGLSADMPDPGVEAYRDVLRHYASGEDGEALRRLQHLEMDPEVSSPELERMRARRLGLLERLVPGEPDLLLPVVFLHETAYLAYLKQNLQTLAFHSRTTMFLLSELYAEHVTTQEHRQRAADLFATLGGYFQESSSDRSAMELFRQSLELDATNEGALLGAAAASERNGRYPRALRYLEALHRAHPGNLEGRLRLAVNLRRTERDSEAMTLVQQLLEMDAPPWVLSLAYQTLADWLLESEKLEEAESVLREAVERFPDDPTLPIAMAYVAERRQPSLPDLDLDATLRAIAESALSPPRFRYALDPVEVFEQSRARLRELANASRGLLEAALARSPASVPRIE